MGKKTSISLTKNKISHLSIVHPVAGGKIRKKEEYCKHVKLVLQGIIENDSIHV